MIEKLKVEFEHCYGIDAMTHTFDFSNNNMPALVYAPNGVMKTSFARTLQNYSEGEEPKDIFFPDKESVFSIVDQNGVAVDPDSIFVVESIDEKYQSKKISSLLASEDLKAQYDEIFGSITEKTDALFKNLKKLSGISKNIEVLFSSAFKVQSTNLMTALARLEREVKEGAHEEFGDLKYKTLFSDKVIEFLGKGDVQQLIENYTKTYEQIIDRSKYFRKGVFNHSNAETIAKNLKANGWFEGGHSVNLKNNDENNEISTEQDLIAAIEEEKQKILSDHKLSEMFQKVDGALTTAELRAFRDYLIEHPFVVPELNDLDAFKQKVWIAYLVKNNAQYTELIAEYDESKEKVKEIISAAEREQTQWEEVLKLFNDRFSVPFEVVVENKGDAVLNIAAPQITFYFNGQEDGERTKTDRQLLDRGLSNGEKRALYILNIIFEAQARRRDNLITIAVFDDIADSFDYKNKYAIIEYLNDMREDQNFRLIILTHNYDFYRTVRSRLRIFGANKLLSNRVDGALQLVEDKLSENPFEDWKQNLSNSEKLVASIPFVRNLSEYAGKQDLFRRLTSLLHIKNETKTITLQDLYEMYAELLEEDSFEVFGDIEELVFEEIINSCESLSGSGNDDLSLEQKITLSIGIRLVAEECLIQKIADPDYVSGINSHQTGKLIRRYQKQENSDPEILKVMKRVSLMTPENIHLNSFMFEPILDMSGHHLKTLYRDVCDCHERVEC